MESTGEAMSNGQAELDQIRSVLFGEHANELDALRATHEAQLRELHTRIEALEQQLNERPKRTTIVGEVITDAIEERQPTEVGTAIKPSVEHAIGASIRDDSSVLAEALYPVLGPAVRKMVANMLTPESLKDGHTFRVEQLLLIERQTGLVLAASALDERKLEDADVVSGMMDAIRRFVQEAFDADDHDGLRDLRVGDTSVLVEWGPQAVLAAVVTGIPDEQFRTEAAVALEGIHRDYRTQLMTFSGDIEPFAAASEDLSNFHGSTESRTNPSKFEAFLPMIATLIVIIVAISLIVWYVNQ